MLQSQRGSPWCGGYLVAVSEHVEKLGASRSGPPWPLTPGRDLAAWHWEAHRWSQEGGVTAVT